MRILLVEPDLFDNGAIRVSLDRARRWVEAGHHVVLFAVHPSTDAVDVEVPDGLELRFATRRDLRLRWRLVAAVARLVGLARQADVVVAGREIGDGLLTAAVAARAARRPLAVTVQSRVDLALEAYVPPRQRGMTRWALASADRAVCVAAGLVPVLAELGVPPERIRVVTNGVDVAGIRRAAEQEPEVPLPDGRPVVVGTGRLNPQKGFDVLVRAHAHALAAGAPDHEVVLLGTGPDHDALEALAAELGVAATVRLAGFVQNPHAVMARSALFTLPSRWEGYPLTLVEAQVLGVPSVAADIVSGPREVLDGSTYGELVAPEDPAALGDAVARHLRDPAPLRAKGRAGAAVAEERYDPEAAARRHLEVLEELARG